MAHIRSRRSFLKSAGAGGAGALLGRYATSFPVSAQEPPLSDAIRLSATMRSLEINGKSATAMGLAHNGGNQGLTLVATQPFDVLLENKLSTPTAIHWHGLHPPNNEDGVPGLTQRRIAPGASERYYFPLKPAGTHWMHSHLGLQEAFLLSAPLIVHERSNEGGHEQEVVLFLGDFSFTSPTEIYAGLRKPKPKMMAMGSSASRGKNMMGMGKPDVNDVDYDAYLANDRTLADPEVVRVEKNGAVRLRIINGSSGTNFFLSLEGLGRRIDRDRRHGSEACARLAFSTRDRAAHRRTCQASPGRGIPHPRISRGRPGTDRDYSRDEGRRGEEVAGEERQPDRIAESEFGEAAGGA
jgi:FtsP/CotA-like multicopper oxidase with cupredoxin domain